MNIANLENFALSGTCEESGQNVTLEADEGSFSVSTTCGSQTEGQWALIVDFTTNPDFADGAAVPYTLSHWDNYGNVEALAVELSVDTISPHGYHW